MKKHLLIALLTLSPLATSCRLADKKKPSLLQSTTRIATYNITHGKKNNWPKRRPGVCKTIETISADIFGLQEVITDNDQLQSMKTTLSTHAYVGEPRNTSIKGLSFLHRLRTIGAPWGLGAQNEYCPIFYNKSKFQLISTDTFGINGNGWESAYLARICTVGQFKDVITGKEFYVYNTHLDHKEDKWRVIQMNIILQDAAKRCGNTPAIIMGDFNTTLEGNVGKALSDAQFTPARNVAQNTQGPIETHVKRKPFACDHILIKPQDAFDIKNYIVVDSISDKTSDHNPVVVDFTLKQ